MTGPNPAYITSADWAAFGPLLESLWWMLGSALIFGFSMLVAHGMIPSLVDTREMDPGRARRIRPVLYVIGLFFLGLGLYSVVQFVDRVGVIPSIFWRGAQ